MPTERAGNLLYIQALTALHPGSGAALGAIDLPIQRERHTGWPTIPGSSIKGVLRDAAVRGGSIEVDKVFGKARDGQDDGGFAAGALSFTDARLLAFPVRSLYGVFSLVTCPAVLSRWQRDAALVGNPRPLPAAAPHSGEAVAVKDSPCVSGAELVLEEFKFQVKPISAPLPIPPIPGLEPKRLIVLHDDDFSHFAHNATEVTARIGLDHSTKTVKTGALFYEEFLPAECLLYSLILRSGRANGLNWVPPSFVQLGADETIGKGLCALVQD